MKVKIFSFLLGFCIICNPIFAKSLDERSYSEITTVLEAETYRNYFVCGNKGCYADEFVRQYYQNHDFNVLKSGGIFWIGMFSLTYFEEIFAVNNYYFNDVPIDLFTDNFYPNRKNLFNKKNKELKNIILKDFINKQISTYKNVRTRLIAGTPIDNSPNFIDYAQTPIVQSFLEIINPNIFKKITYRIAQNPSKNSIGLPEFAIWNENELFFVFVKAYDDKISVNQAEWIKFLEKNKNKCKIVRVKERQPKEFRFYN